MSDEDKKLLLEMKDNCLNASVYDDENRLLKANAITNVLKEIEHLNTELNRFNNIINNLEKWLLEEHKKKQKWYNEQLSIRYKIYYEEKYVTSLTMIDVFYDKLQELKGSDTRE